MVAKGLYVETFIHADVEEVWRKTQMPELHEQWDLRFSTITYLPKDASDLRGETQPQRFEYATRIGFGLAVRGGGESLGERNSETERTSALKFWSEERLSLIREGSGYWKYVVEAEGVRFFTWYDYRVRFGLLGQIFDRMCFRSLMGWATAWSFDRLRLWIEEDVTPRQALAWTSVYTVCRVCIAGVWLWHGLVPKLLFPQTDELRMLAEQGLSGRWLPWAGGLEVAFGLVGLAAWRWRGFFAFTILAMVAALGSVALRSPEYVTRAFNPVTLNVAVIGLALTGYAARPWAVFAGRCKRHPARRNV